MKLYACLKTQNTMLTIPFAADTLEAVQQNVISDAMSLLEQHQADIAFQSAIQSMCELLACPNGSAKLQVPTSNDEEIQLSLADGFLSIQHNTDDYTYQILEVGSMSLSPSALADLSDEYNLDYCTEAVKTRLAERTTRSLETAQAAQLIEDLSWQAKEFMEQGYENPVNEALDGQKTQVALLTLDFSSLLNLFIEAAFTLNDGTAITGIIEASDDDVIGIVYTGGGQYSDPAEKVRHTSLLTEHDGLIYMRKEHVSSVRLV